MAKYILKPSTESVYFIRYRGSNIGSVFKHATEPKWVSKIGAHVAYGPTAADAFHAIVAIRNRVSICGENDHDKAEAALRERNERTAAEVESFNALLRGTGLPPMRVRTRKIRI